MEADREIKSTVKPNPEKDLVSLYFLTRRSLTEVGDSFRVYELLVQAITIGDGLISDPKIKDEIKAFLTNDGNYPKLTDMEFQPDSHTYSVGTGHSGIISVRPEDLETGRKHFKDQQLNTIIPKLRLLDNKVLETLIKEKEIPRNSKVFSDVLKEKIIKKMES